MKCAYHPESDAKVHCSKCERPLCGQCVIPEGNGTFICSRCVAITAAQDFVQEEHRHLEEKKSKRQVQKTIRRRRTRLKTSLAATLALAVIIVNMVFYFSSSIPEGETFIPSEHPIETAIVIDSAIRGYSEEHAGKTPQTLDEIWGEYLPPEVIEPTDLEIFSYSRTSDYSYELRPKDIEDEMISDLVFTEGGPKW